MKQTILLVDDDDLILKGTGMDLNAQGYQVTTANSGEKAIELLKKDSFDLVITDLIMGAVDGMAVLKQTKKHHPETMVVVLTGHGDRTAAIEALRSRADDFMLKPCNPAELHHRVDFCLKQSKLKKKLKAADKALHNASELESLAFLSGGIAHDFNNLLYVILGNISLVQDDIKPGTQIFESLKEAESACMKAKKLTARLISFSNGGSPIKKICTIDKLLKNSVASLLSESEIKSNILSDDSLRQVNIDKTLIKQAFHNIIVNAKEAMDNKGQLKVSCENIDIDKQSGLPLGHGEYVKICFKDQGCGISKENLEKIFKPYFTTKEMGTNKGQGLGLTISYSTIKKHKGLITVESELEIGSTVSVYLPAVLIKDAESKTMRQNSLRHEPVELAAAGKGKILLMDDEKTIRSFLSKVIKRLGYNVETCIEGKEAVEIYKVALESREPFDVIILDLTNKFGMGGKETMKKLLEIDHAAQGICISGYSDDPVVENFREYGFSGFLKKPATKKELTNAINRVISKNQ
ncbi:MAG: response regulator [Desulfobacteraceae bacterium]|nr:response regulator [Desulfobacteraceae bacterium]